MGEMMREQDAVARSAHGRQVPMGNQLEIAREYDLHSGLDCERQSVRNIQISYRYPRGSGGGPSAADLAGNMGVAVSGIGTDCQQGDQSCKRAEMIRGTSC